MVTVKSSPSLALVQAVAVINILGNLAAVGLTFIYFGVFEPQVTGNVGTAEVWDRLAVAGAVTACVLLLIAPINARCVWGLAREVREKTGAIKGTALEGQEELLNELIGRVLNLPARLGLTTLAGWALGAAIFSVLPILWPNFYPWTVESSRKIAIWLLLVVAPATMCWIYFAQERWLRINVRRMFPLRALAKAPSCYRINVLPKMLVVTLPVTIVPLLLLSHVTIHQVSEIQAGRQSVESFLANVPTIIEFLAALFAFTAASLSFFLAKSISEPLKDLESAMEKAAAGDMYAMAPVLSNDEIGKAEEGFNRMVEERRELDSIKDTFGRYLSKDVVEEILRSGGKLELEGNLRDMTILVADIRGFTRMTESLPPQKVLAVVNRYLETMTDIIMQYSGTIDEFTGDGILVFFGAPKHIQDHCMRGVACALDMQKAMDALNARNVRDGLPAIQAGIGINSGVLIVGNIGSEKRKKYGAVGSPINVAFRIQAEALGGEIVVSPEVVSRLQGQIIVKHKKLARLKGLDRPMELFCLESLGQSCEVFAGSAGPGSLSL
jgi:adenylate cyclase|uniref:Adenylate/guanylate cyclase domain-containing protein n=1 Tax=Desulfomonile tiedjei TaxID=2358 RepID=A0A7C4ASD3_9BACT